MLGGEEEKLDFQAAFRERIRSLCMAVIWPQLGDAICKCRKCAGEPLPRPDSVR